MKKIYSLLLCAFALVSAQSCDTTNNDPEDPEVPSVSYLYVLNSGSYGSNNSTLTSYGFDAASTVDDLFNQVNGQGLGDTAQDILVFGDNIYITLYGSGVIFVTDLEGKIVTQITSSTYTLPRYLATDGSYIYVSYYDGGVAKINPSTAAIVSEAAVSINPEQLVASNDKLYVTISQGYGNYNDCNTIDVYDTATLTYEKSLEVILNPTCIEADSKGNLYVISMGNYGWGDPAIYATLQKVDASTGELTVIDVTDIEDATPTMMTMCEDILYVVEGVNNESTSWKMVGDIYAYDTASGSISTFITDGTTIADIYSISSDQTTGEIYVGTSDYYNTGDVYVLNADGTYNTTIGVGVNPIAAVLVSIEVEE